MPRSPHSWIIAALLWALSAAGCARAPAPLPAGNVRVEGWLASVSGPETHYFLSDDRGGTTELRVSDEVWAVAGGPRALDRMRVTVVARREADGSLRVVSIQPHPTAPSR